MKLKKKVRFFSPSVFKNKAEMRGQQIALSFYTKKRGEINSFKRKTIMSAGGSSEGMSQHYQISTYPPTLWVIFDITI